MIRKIVLLTLLSGFAAGYAQAADLKIAYINLEQILEKAPQMIAVQEAFRKKFGARQKAITDLQIKLRKIEERIKREGATMTDSQARELTREGRRLERTYEDKVFELQNDRKEFRDKEVTKAQRAVMNALESYVKQQKYDLVLASAIYANDKTDITEEVLKILKTSFKKDAGK